MGDYPDYDNYKKALLKNKEKEDMLYDNTRGEKELESLRELIAMINVGRENFKKMFGAYEISESDYYTSPNSLDCTNEKLIYDFGILPEIEEDVDMDKVMKNAKK